MERSTSLILPSAGNRRYATGRMHSNSAISLTREPIAQAKESLLCISYRLGKFLNLLN